MPPQPPEHVEASREQLQHALGARYVIERELGRGGMATVYLARDSRHRRPVAVKVLHPELSAALGAERFLKEIELTASLQHPHILPLFDSGAAAGGLLYYVMPYVEGETLRARLEREQQLPVGDALRIATRGGRRARLRARPGRRAPRHQAGERAAARRTRARGRLRHRARGPAGWRRAHDADRALARHAAVHGARAGHGGARDHGARGHLRARRRDVRDARRPSRRSPGPRCRRSSHG